jgi:hypothetical protein
MDAAAHATKIWRTNVGHGQCQWPQVFVPLRSVPGAMPVYFWSASVEA